LRIATLIRPGEFEPIVSDSDQFLLDVAVSPLVVDVARTRFWLEWADDRWSRLSA
jgi:hypothetical protein